MRTCRGWLFIYILSASWSAHAQDADSLLVKPDSILSYSDSLSIFKLIDSLLSLPVEEPASQLGFRLSYNSNVMSAGRTLGIDQFGLAPGVSYYHKTGLYADASFYWSNDFDPTYYLTILSAGYMHAFSKKFSVIASYDRYFYRFDEDFTPYENALTVSPFLDLTYVTFRFDYSFFFGDQQAHRLLPSISGNLEKRNFLGLNKITFAPGIFVLLGNETITELILPQTSAEWIIAWIKIRNGLPWYTIETRNEFGIMNYAFTAPLYMHYRNWTFSASYTYNIPKALPGETLTLSESGFVSASIMYLLPLRRKKATL
ncbi:hypothetical protein QQ054_13880 [Oscillatoria amoena NRMC-F 0135]|nr:hypothetical protein [Oscillatoria amoena NRMC-F 0135]